MALIPCSECGAKVSTEAATCPHCGAKPRTTKWWLWIPLTAVVALSAILVTGAILGSSPEGKAKAEAREIIASCWKEQERKSNSPGDSRFLAGACERMEADYKTRFGHAP